MFLKQIFATIFIILLTLSFLSCSIDKVENEIRRMTSGSKKDSSRGKARVHKLMGKWRFSLYGEISLLTCYLNPRGKTLSGSCYNEYLGEKVATLSLSDYGSKFYFNLISQKTNTLVADGPLYLERDDHLEGECSFIYPDGKKEYKKCSLKRD